MRCRESRCTCTGAQVSVVEQVKHPERRRGWARLRKGSELGTLLCTRGQLLGAPEVLQQLCSVLNTSSGALVRTQAAHPTLRVLDSMSPGWSGREFILQAPR